MKKTTVLTLSLLAASISAGQASATNFYTAASWLQTYATTPTGAALNQINSNELVSKFGSYDNPLLFLVNTGANHLFGNSSNPTVNQFITNTISTPPTFSVALASFQNTTTGHSPGPNDSYQGTTVPSTYYGAGDAIDTIKADIESKFDVANLYNSNGIVGATDTNNGDAARYAKDFQYDEKRSSVAAMIWLRGVPVILSRWVSHAASTQPYISNLRVTLPSQVAENLNNEITNQGLTQAQLVQLNQQGASTTLTSDLTDRGLFAKDSAALNTNQSVWDQLFDMLQGKDGETAFTKTLAKAWVGQTGIDPVAGNPDSLLAKMTDTSFNLAANGIYDGKPDGLGLFSVKPSYSRSTNNGYVNQTFSVPLEYTYSIDKNSALTVEAPINYTDIDGAKTYDGALDVGYSRVIMRKPKYTWAVTPNVFVGALGSADMAAGTAVMGAGVSSQVSVPFKAWTVGMTNDVNYVKTAKVKIGDIETPYDLNNILTKNGLEASYQISAPYEVGGYFDRTDVVSGEEWYMKSANEVGAKFTKLSKTANNVAYDGITASVGYKFAAHDYKGFNLNAGFTF